MVQLRLCVITALSVLTWVSGALGQELQRLRDLMCLVYERREVSRGSSAGRRPLASYYRLIEGQSIHNRTPLY